MFFAFQLVNVRTAPFYRRRKYHAYTVARDFLGQYADFLTVSDAIMISAVMTKGAAESIYNRQLIVNREHSAVLGIASPRGENQLVSTFESVGKTVSVLNGKRVLGAI